MIQGLVMLFAVSAIVFALLASAGGDAFTSLRDNPQISEQTIEKMRRVYGLDRPLPVRFAKWIGSAATGDLGESMYFRAPVGGLIWRRALDTAVLGILALLLASIVAAVLSFLSARYPSRTLERLIETIVLLTASAPRIVLALIGLALAVRIGVAGNSTVMLFLAAGVLAVPVISLFLAQFHEELRQAMNADFVQLARAKGLSERIVIVRHASRAALDPVLTVFGLSLGALLGGSVIVEAVLGRSGIGTLMVTAVTSRDVPLVMGIVLTASTAVWAGNAAAEILQAVNDKRIRG